MEDAQFTSRVRDLIFRFRPEFLNRGSVPESSIRPSSVSGEILKTVSGITDWSGIFPGAFAASMYAANSGAPTHTNNGGYQKVGSGGGTLTWTSEFDVRPSGYAAQVDTATNKRIDIKYSGLYQISWGGAFTAITDGKIMDWSVYKNGAQLFGMGLTNGVAATPGVKVSRVAALSSGDYLELYAYQNDSASEAYYTPSQYSPYLQVFYLGPSS